MYSVYVLKSLNHNWFYIGLTANKERRVKQHNKGRVFSTKHYLPFTLVHEKTFISRVDARNFEKFLKIRSNKEKLLRSLHLK